MFIVEVKTDALTKTLALNEQEKRLITVRKGLITKGKSTAKVDATLDEIYKAYYEVFYDTEKILEADPSLRKIL